jgi:hypothetical protein
MYSSMKISLEIPHQISPSLIGAADLFPLRQTLKSERSVRRTMKLKEIKMMTVVSLVLAFALAALVVAQQPAKPVQEKQRRGQMMSMDEMMQECRKHFQETARSVDQTTKMMEEAEQSNDPARMRDALGQSRKSLAEMKNHMDMCMNMMDMMEKMRGKGQKKQ